MKQATRLAAAALAAANLIASDAGAQIDVPIAEGAGRFSIQGGPGHTETKVIVSYYRPRNFDERSPILIVVPGDGRNGDDYRDAWIAAAERHDILVLSPSYPRPDYDEAAYLLAGTVENLELRNLNQPNPDVFQLNDEDIVFDVTDDRSRWLFHDFDRLFDIVVDAVGSRQAEYDIFGHSAGGQIVHRMAIFHADSKARRMVAANSGFYTLPSTESPLIFGVADAPLTSRELRGAFSERLILLLGESDDADERRGQRLSTPKADAQGIGRLARGRYFYRQSRGIAEAMNAPFRWRVAVVPDVGHDYRLMSEAAARLLYGTETER